jgi:hypothetical protein
VWVRAGDGEWRIPRRPPRVMDEHWKRLDLEDDEQSRWIPRDLPQSSHWRTEGRAIAARGRGTAAFRGGREPIRDGYLDGYPEELLPWIPGHAAESGQHVVADLRVEGEITALAGLESFTVVLAEGVRRYRFELPGPSAAAGAEARIDAGPSARAAAPARAPFVLPAGTRVRFAVENLDDRLALEIDGRELLALEIEPGDEASSAIDLELEGEGADLAGLMAYRDVHYTGGGAPLAIPAGRYFMLGDNTQDSSDSREWNFVTYRLLDGAAPGAPAGEGAQDDDLDLPAGRAVRGNWRNGENPRTVYGPEGPVTTLVDEWGERHWFRPEDARRGPPEAAPFVPRALIQGKALAGVWPLDGKRVIWRLRWGK